MDETPNPGPHQCAVVGHVGLALGEDGLQDALDIGALGRPALAHHLHELALRVEGHLIDPVVQRPRVLHPELHASTTPILSDQRKAQAQNMRGPPGFKVRGPP
jgi:hypothetical protein